MTRRSACHLNHLVGVDLCPEVPEGGGLALYLSHLLPAGSSLKGTILKDLPQQVDEDGHLPMDATTTKAVAGVGEVVARALSGKDYISLTRLSPRFL